MFCRSVTLVTVLAMLSLAVLAGRRKLNPNSDSSRPTLRRAPGSGTGPVDANDDGTRPKTDEDERPTLKRRDGGG